MTLHTLAPGPVLVFGGPYSNLAATSAIQSIAQQRGLAPQNCICTGDVVAYCAHPEETAQHIRAWGIPVVMGNCEQSLAEQAQDCGCGFNAGSTCSALAADWYGFAQRRISADTRQWMRNLPRSIRFAIGQQRFSVVHGSASRINQFVFPSTPQSIKRDEIKLADTDILIGGHCGIPFGERIGKNAWLNAGAIGLPANDGTPDGWYMLLTPTAQGVEASWHRLKYPAKREAAAMRTRGLASDYAQALLDGLWPSMDVLPEVEQKAQAMALAPVKLRLPDSS